MDKNADLLEWARKTGNFPDLFKFLHEEATNKMDKELTIREKEKMLAVILGMAIYSYGYDPQEKRNNAT